MISDRTKAQCQMKLSISNCKDDLEQQRLDSLVVVLSIDETVSIELGEVKSSDRGGADLWDDCEWMNANLFVVTTGGLIKQFLLQVLDMEFKVVFTSVDQKIPQRDHWSPMCIMHMPLVVVKAQRQSAQGKGGSINCAN